MNFKIIIAMLCVVIGTQVFANYEHKHSIDALLKKTKKFFNDLKSYKRCKKTEYGCPAELRWRLLKRSSCLAKKTKSIVGAKLDYMVKRHHHKQPSSEQYFAPQQHGGRYYPESSMNMPAWRSEQPSCPCHYNNQMKPNFSYE